MKLCVSDLDIYSTPFTHVDDYVPLTISLSGNAELAWNFKKAKRNYLWIKHLPYEVLDEDQGIATGRIRLLDLPEDIILTIFAQIRAWDHRARQHTFKVIHLLCRRLSQMVKIELFRVVGLRALTVERIEYFNSHISVAYNHLITFLTFEPVAALVALKFPNSNECYPYNQLLEFDKLYAQGIANLTNVTGLSLNLPSHKLKHFCRDDKSPITDLFPATWTVFSQWKDITSLSLTRYSRYEDGNYVRESDLLEMKISTHFPKLVNMFVYHIRHDCSESFSFDFPGSLRRLRYRDGSLDNFLRFSPATWVNLKELYLYKANLCDFQTLSTFLQNLKSLEILNFSESIYETSEKDEDAPFSYESFPNLFCLRVRNTCSLDLRVLGLFRNIRSIRKVVVSKGIGEKIFKDPFAETPVLFGLYIEKNWFPGAKWTVDCSKMWVETCFRGWHAFNETSDKICA